MRNAFYFALASACFCAGPAGCDSTPTPAPAGPTNVVDQVVIPMLNQNGFAVSVEDPAILCRRLAVDLTGVAPSPADQAACAGLAPAAMADYFMNKPSGPNAPDGSPPYVFVNRRFWADSFQYETSFQVATTFYSYSRDLDALVGDLYSGKISYDVFARRALGSPAFARRFGIFEANHDLVQLASQAYRVFLGREALPSEAEDFGNLWRGWSTKFMDEATAETAYPGCPQVLNQLMQPVGCRHYELGLDGTQCADAQLAACESTVLGPAAAAPTALTFVRWSELNDTDLTMLETPGRLIASQPEFAEAAVDRALAKYLGWWKAGTYRPDFDVPAVRDALAAKFVADGFDIRKLELEIVTSVLYTQRAALGPNQLPTDPLFAFGPTKALYAEAWLDSVGQALSKQLGGCDWRYESVGTGVSKIDGFLNFPISTGIAKSLYFNDAQNMGGCPVASVHGDNSGLVPSVTKRVALASLCPGSFKPQSGLALDALAKLEFAGIGRAPNSTELQTLVTRMSVPADGGCDPAALAACKTQALADALCTSLYASSLFNYY